MTTKPKLLVLSAALAVACITGVIYWMTLPRLDLWTELRPDESVEKGMTVMVDDVPAGVVTAIEQRGVAKVARLRLNQKDIIESKARQGMVRVAEQQGAVRLVTDLAATEAAPLTRGAFIPTKGKFEILALKYSDSRNWGVVGAVIALIGTFGFVLLRFLRVGALLIALLVATGAAWLLHPLVIPLVEQVYANMPEQRVAGSVERSTITSASAASVEERLLALTRQRPAPRTVAFAVAFIGCVMVTTTAARLFSRC